MSHVGKLVGMALLFARVAMAQVPVPPPPVPTDTLRGRPGDTLAARVIFVPTAKQLRLVNAAGTVLRRTILLDTTATVITNPGTVTDVRVASTDTTSITIAWTAPTDGAGRPASVVLRWAAGTFSWGSATGAVIGPTGAIGTLQSFRVTGLLSGTTYQTQLVAFRGTLDASAVFGRLSNIASGTTAAGGPPPPPPPPPPPSGGGTWPNEPAGMTVVSDYDFSAPVPATNQGDLLGGGWRDWWNTAGRGTRASDPTAPFSPPYVWQVLYPVGFPSGLEPAMVEYLFNPHVQELYWGFFWKPSSPFQSDPSGVNKIAFVWTPSGSTDLLYFDLSPGPWRIRGMDDLIAGGGPDAGKRNEPNVTTTTIVLNQWYRIEIYLKYSTGNNADGIMRWWVNGTLNGEYMNLKMVQDGGFDHLQFAPTFGGNTGAVKNENDYYWYDHVHVSVR